MNFVTKTLAATSLVAGLAAAASAATITPTSAVGSSSYPGYNDVYAIDGDPVTDWASLGQGSSSSILFVLGGSYALTGASVTDRVTSGGGNGGFVGGTTDFTTSYKLDFYSNAAGTSLVGTYFSPTLVAPVSPTLPSQFLNSPTFSWTAVSVRYSVLAAGPSNNPGLSEITFEGTAVTPGVPEASTWMLMIAGFGMVGVAARRRKTVVVA